MDSKQRLLADLDEVLLAETPQLHFAPVCGEAANLPHYFTTDIPHWEILLRGRLPLMRLTKEGAHERILRRGDVFCLFPGEGVGRRQDTARELLVLNFYPDGIECYHSYHVFRDGQPTFRRDSYHTSAPLERGGLHLLKAFQYYAAGVDNELPAVLFRAVLQRVREQIRSDQPQPDLRAQHTYRMILQYLRECCCAGISRKTVAAEFELSPDYLSHLFHRFGAESFHLTLLRLRMEKAAHLLRHTNDPASAVGKTCGFDDPAYFSKTFRRYHRQSPSEYRRDSFRGPTAQTSDRP